MRRWTISDIAREARVSKTTVSRVLNNRPDVDQQTSARVRAVVDDLGFVPSARAVRLAKGRANAVGLLGPFDTSPWMIEVLRGAMERVQEADFSLTLHAFPDTPETGERLAIHLRGGLIDALLVVSLRQPLPLLRRLAAEGLPIVYLNDYGFNEGAPEVVPDERVGITAAVDHLFAVGRRRFAILAGTRDYPVSEPRLNAYRDAIRARGLDLDSRLVIEAPFTEPTAQIATEVLIARGIPFDALFVSSDAMAVGAMRVLKRQGFRIPDDVSVVGFDDFASAEFTEPRLTTVHNPLSEMSGRAVARLIGAIKGEKALDDSEEVVRTHLIVRDSSDPSLLQTKEET